MKANKKFNKCVQGLTIACFVLGNFKGMHEEQIR